MGLFDFLKPKPKMSHTIILASIHGQTLTWAHNIFKPVEKYFERQPRYEYLVAFSGTIATQCYLFAATGIKNQQPDTDSVITFIQSMADHLREDAGTDEPELFLQEMMTEYRDLFTNGMARQNMHELCSEFTFHYTLLDGLADQINQLNETIQMQCNIITRAAVDML